MSLEPKVSIRAGGPIVYEEGCKGLTSERKYYRLENVYIKRSLRSHEFSLRPRDTPSGPAGGIVVIPFAKERLQNEAACIRYIRANTSIPVPYIVCEFEDDQAYYLITEIVKGVEMADLTEEQKSIVEKELKEHTQAMHSLRSKKAGGPSGLVIYPSRAQRLDRDTMPKLREADSATLVFCHGDLRQPNIIVDPDTLKIQAILDWEYAGFYPRFFERLWYRRAGPAAPIRGHEEDDRPNIQSFFEHWSAETTHDPVADTKMLELEALPVGRFGLPDIENARLARAKKREEKRAKKAKADSQ